MSHFQENSWTDGKMDERTDGKILFQECKTTRMDQLILETYTDYDK